MRPLTPRDLPSLEGYAASRAELLPAAMAHRRLRRVALGPHMSLAFEDRETVLHQLREMLRIERLFEPGEIAAELAAYNPLIPDGSDWRATLMIEYPDEGERRAALRRLAGVEHCIQVQVGALAPVTAIADEDLPRGDERKTAAVHFLRFPLTAAQRRSLLQEGAAIVLAVDHPHYQARSTVSDDARLSLLADLQP